MALCLALLVQVLVLASAKDASNCAHLRSLKTDDDLDLVWSDPVLVDDFAYRLPVPDHFYAFEDHRHMFGTGLSLERCAIPHR